MKLAKAVINNFRSIQEATIFIENNITALVGANEHGKSNILKALYYLNPANKFDLEKDQRVTTEVDEYLPEITYFIQLDTDDKKALKEQIFPLVMENLDASEKTRKFAIDELYLQDSLVYKRYFENKKEFYGLDYGTFGLPQELDDTISDIFYNYLIQKLDKRVIYFDDFTDKLNSIISQTELSDKKNLVISGLLKVSGLNGFESKIFSDDERLDVHLKMLQVYYQQILRKHGFKVKWTI